MLDEEKASLLGENFVKVLNPLSREMSALRTSLIPSARDVVKHNFGYGVKNLNFFEIGKVFRLAFDEDEKPRYVDNSANPHIASSNKGYGIKTTAS